ncbi:MAG: hypothetical protein HKN67_06965, partial [Saprospiraceae bacterium]|nr:hypothetical protein [Saprospiraceae bacterium]
MPCTKQIIFVFFLLTHLAGYTQDNNLSIARKALLQGQYTQAVKYFSQYEDLDNDGDALQELGEAYFHLNELTQTVMNLTRAKKLGNNSPELFLRMAQVQHHRREYEEAAFFYKEYLKAVDGQGKDYETVIRELKNCMFALSGKKTKDKVLVQSFDETVNSLFDEIKPLQSPQYG